MKPIICFFLCLFITSSIFAKEAPSLNGAPAAAPAKPASAPVARPEAVKQEAVKPEEAKFRAPEMVAIPGKNYEMGKYEVTQAEWKAVMGNNPSGFQGAKLPVEQVSWSDAQEYIKKLNQMTGKNYRLPKETEWEYACYGGSTAPTEYCGGNDINSVAWYASNSETETHPVGQKQPNGYGLYDMSGNVWEWMDECYQGMCEGGCCQRMVRGGSWYSIPKAVRVEYRGRVATTFKFNVGGFRLARTLP